MGDGPMGEEKMAHLGRAGSSVALDEGIALAENAPQINDPQLT